MTSEFQDILDILAEANGAVLYWQMPIGAKAALDAGVVTIDDNDLMVHPNAIGPDENGQYTMPVRHIVRDTATKGCDFLLWGDDTLGAAKLSFIDAIADGLDVELVSMPANQMDDHTKRLIDG